MTRDALPPDPATPGPPPRPVDWEQRTVDYQRHLATAAEALVAAIRTEVTDGAEIISHLLATAAANLGGIHMLTAARPGSWEADYVDQFLGATVGLNGEYLLQHRTAPIEVVECIEQAMADLGIGGLYDDSFMLIDAADDDAADAEDDAAYDAAMARINHAEQLLDELRERDYAAYREAFEQQVQTAVTKMCRSRHLPDSVPVSVRWVEWAERAQATGDQEAWGTVDKELWETARDKTPPPGFTEPLAEIPGPRSPGDILRATGRMPHQRIPELAHYAATSAGEAR
jgi:hypothetical protein